MSYSKKTLASRQQIQIRAEERAERRANAAPLAGAAKAQNAAQVKLAVWVAKPPSEKARLYGRRKLVSAAAKVAGVPWNTPAPESIEQAARLAGWLRAAAEDPRCAAARRLLGELYYGDRGMASPYHIAGDPAVLMAIWPSPRMVTHEARKGMVWVAERMGWEVAKRLTRQAAHALGRVSCWLRYALTLQFWGDARTAHEWWLRRFECEPRPLIRRGDLDWATAAMAQAKPRLFLLKYEQEVGRGAEWERQTEREALARALWEFRHRCAPADGVGTFDVNAKALAEVLAECPVRTAEYAVPAVQLVRLFGSAGQIRRFVVKSQGEWSAKAIHDAGQFTLPAGRIAPQLGQVVLQAPALARQLGLAEDLLRLNGGKVPATPGEFREALSRLPVMSQFGMVARELGISSYEEADYAALFERGPKSFVGVPAPGGSEGIAEGSYCLRQLASDDYLQPLAGRMVDCCQHLHGAAASCARASWLEGDAAIWAVFHGRTMVAQAFVWRGVDDSLVVDSVEGFRDYRERVASLFHKAAKLVLGRLGVQKVYVGDTSYGGTKELLSHCHSDSGRRPECGFHLGYTDATSVRLLEELQHPVPAGLLRATVRAASEVAREQYVVNALLEGSDVYCEHCEAEVHPDCEICPACGENIAEWV